MGNKVRVRFAPSPTGALHIGGVRTALYNYLFAKHLGGDMLLRIEDTDSNRFVPGAEAYIIESLQWLGLKFDEGIDLSGKSYGAYGPYRQSERRDIYRQYVQQLLEAGRAYIAFDTPEELDAKRAEVANFQYDASTRLGMRNSLSMPEEEVQSLLDQGVQYVVRFRIEAGETVVVRDIIRGEVSFDSSLLDDKVLYKSADDLPTYHLANIVDDHLMLVTHVIRGEEWLPSAPLHVLLYRAFGWEETMPRFAHLPLLLKPDGNGKLSKRDGDRLGFPVFPLEWQDPKTGEVSSGYRESGYLPEAVVNFVALLGWNPGGDASEIMSMDELIGAFSLEKCSKSGAKFDYNKGKWFNHSYIQTAEIERLSALVRPLLLSSLGRETLDEALLERAILLVRDRAQLLSDLSSEVEYFFQAPKTFDEKAVGKRWKPDTAEQLKALISFLTTLPEDLEVHATEEAVKGWIEEQGFGLGAVMNAVRLSLVGALKGPNIFDILHLIGKEEATARLRYAIDKLG